jgi:pimeloyl-ACP methyl ester carboxylesterase
MTTFVLVHGGLHGSWCWAPVAGPLRAAGHDVTAVDLPGRPGGPEGSSCDMASYVDVITGAIDDASGPVVLAVHSLGGVAASLAAESRAEAISRIVFVNSLLLNDGETAIGALLSRGEESALSQDGALVPSPDGATIAIASIETAIDAFYNCCEPDVARRAAIRLVPEPLPPVLEQLSITAAQFGAVPKTYVGARRDRVLPWAMQTAMADAYSAKFIELGGDHSPFLSATDELLAVLDQS